MFALEQSGGSFHTCVPTLGRNVKQIKKRGEDVFKKKCGWRIDVTVVRNPLFSEPPFPPADPGAHALPWVTTGARACVWNTPGSLDGKQGPKRD